MSATPLLGVLQNAPEYNRFEELLTAAQGPAAAFGLPEPHRAHVLGALAQRRTVLMLAASEQAAERLYAQASALCPNALYLPAREIPLVHAYAASGGRAKERITTLSRLCLNQKEPLAVVASIETAMQRLAPLQVLQRAIKTLQVGMEIPPRSLLRDLLEAGYEAVELVEGPGQAAARGDIVDCYPPHGGQPCRLEFFGDEIDRISFFDPVSQRSLEQVQEILITPATEAPQEPQAITRALAVIEHAKGFDAQRIAWEEGRACPGAESLLPILYPGDDCLLDYLSQETFLLLEEPQRLEEACKTAYRLFSQEVSAMLDRGEGIAQQSRLLCSPEDLFRRLDTRRTGLLYALKRSFGLIRARDSVDFDARTAPQYPLEAGREELARDIQLWKRTGNAVLLFAGAHAQRLRQQLLDCDCETAFSDGLTRPPVPGEALILSSGLPQGLYWPSLHLIVLSQQELFGSAARIAPRRHSRRSGKPQLAFTDLKPGDLVVHETHGIGRFLGVESLTVQDNTRDYLLLQYAGGDKLYIPTDQLDRVQKYIGGSQEGASTLEGLDGPAGPRLSRLGGSDWQRQVNKARGAVKALAFDLAALYARRDQEKGFAFSVDTPWQRQLEERFPYEETPDQLQCIREIKQDMERPRPMDRLLCGDVGYGKTEVALRAAFKAVQDSKQVAFLVPTTILAQQHYNTLSARFEGFPIRLALLSRFKTPQEQKKIKEGVASGQIDILIGTHALLGKEVKFKDLGLLIVDEEQRFGVGHKEQIKAFKSNIDVLTLSATPIPRTLHMSMVGIRDMSVIETPPEERYPVQTYVLEYSDALVLDAMRKELGRGGQCYIVYNRVQQMEHFTSHLADLFPEARFAHAHGQMQERLLEGTMLDFLEHRIDVLVCSTIIENGLDISNANTMIVVDADKMGLAQLYQLRGRVGRSTRLGYAYFTFQRDKVLTEIAHKRLLALSEFTQFGAGFQIAMRDLEIRGAGSLLGAQQHGHIADVGYEYYCKLMDQALREAKGEAVPLEVDTVVDVPVDAHIPRNYIANEVLRLQMYKRIALIDGQEALFDVQEELEDRYGDIPGPVQNLMDVALVKAKAAKAQVASLTIRDGSAKLVFHPDAQLDGERFVSAAGAFGAQILSGADQMALQWKQSGKEAIAVLHGLAALLDALGACPQEE